MKLRQSRVYRRVTGLVTRRLRADLGRATLVMAFGMGLKLLIQIASFTLVAGFMGAAEFGLFATVVAVVGVIATLSGWGGDHLLIRRVARRPEEFRPALGTGLAFLLVTALPLVAVIVAVAPLLVDRATALWLIAPVALSDVLFARTNLLVVGCYRGVGQAGRATWSNFNFSAARLVAAGAWAMLMPAHDAASWSLFYCAASGLAAATSLPRLFYRLGTPVWQVAWHEWRDGFNFATQQAASTIYENIDKPLVAFLSNLSVAGTYAAASRIADASAMPLRALFYATYPEFFRIGAEGMRSNAEFAIRLLPVSLVSGAIGALGILAIAPIAPQLLGHSYEGTYAILLVFMARPVLSAVEHLGVDVLTTSGRTGLRTLLTAAQPFLKTACCFALVPSWGAIGAAIAELLTLGFLLAASWSAIWIFTRGPRPLPAAASDAGG